MKIVYAFTAVSILALSGCVSAQMAEDQAQYMAADQCAKMGKQFVQTGGSAGSDGAVAGATAKGRCVGPGDPDYVPPPPPPGR